jgi:hypothetical protein
MVIVSVEEAALRGQDRPSSCVDGVAIRRRSRINGFVCASQIPASIMSSLKYWKDCDVITWWLGPADAARQRPRSEVSVIEQTTTKMLLMRNFSLRLSRAPGIPALEGGDVRHYMEDSASGYF